MNIDETDAETNPEDDSDAKNKKGPKIKEINLESDKPEPSEEAKKAKWNKNDFPVFRNSIKSK